MGKAAFMRKRNVYFYRFRQLGILTLAAVGSVALLTNDVPIEPQYQYALVAVFFGFALYRVFRAEMRRMKSHRLFLLPKGDGSLKQFGQASDARWLSLWELISRRWKKGDAIIGNPLPEQSFFGLFGRLLVGDDDKRHSLTLALTGMGKTTCVVIPNLLTYPGSALVVDPKGELAEITAARRGNGDSDVTETLGQDVHILDPFNTVPHLPKSRFNPLAELDPYDKSVVDDTTVIVDALIPKSAASSGNQDFFESRARSLLKAIILHVLSFEPPERHTLTYIRQLVTSGDQEAMDMANAACRASNAAEAYDNPFDALFDAMAFNPSYNGLIANQGKGLSNTAPDELSGILGTCETQTSFLDSPAIYEMTKASDFSLRDLKRRKTTIYICLPALKIAGTYVRILTLLITMCAEMMERERTKLDHPVLFMFDEFSAYDYMEAIEKSFGLMRGMGMKLWVVIQDLSQIQKQYPKTWQNIEANTGFMQVLGVKNYDTAQFISSRLPTAQLKTAAGTQDVPLMSAQDIVNEFSDPDERRQLYIPIGGTPALLRTTHYTDLFPKSMYSGERS